LRPRKEGEREKGVKIFKVAIYLEARPILLEANCTKSNESHLLEKIIFYKKKLF